MFDLLTKVEFYIFYIYCYMNFRARLMITYIRKNQKHKNTPISLPTAIVKKQNLTDNERDTMFAYTFAKTT